ncbi:MAG: HAMP domain-containing protein [Clostridia bacterium]|nr:HAMP domain-containing protein [Clostridia bacterium]
MKKLSFKMRITIFTGIIVAITAVSLTIISMYNAREQINLIISTETPAIGAEDMQNDVNYSIDTPDTQNETMPSAAVSSATVKNAEPFADYVEHYTVTTAQTATRRFNITSIIAMVVIGALGMLFAYILAGKSLKPIKELDETAANITENDLNTRLPARNTNDEISSLTDSFNAMLDRLNDAFENQKRFSANAAHELKTPIAVMKTGMQVVELDDNITVDDYKEIFTVVKRNVNRLADIIDDLLTLTSRTNLPCEKVSINDVITEITEDLLLQYAEKEIEITYRLEDDIFVLQPATLVRRLFCNLIENAFKYNKQNGRITIAASKIEEGCKVSIRDSGMGIPEPELKNIWDAFYCVDVSRSKKLGGVGLGLSIVKEIADRFGWNVSLHSQEGIYTESIVECKK